MIPPNERGYRDNNSDPSHAFDYFDRYLEGTQSSYSSLDSTGNQSEGSSFAASSTPKWFNDFILYESDDINFQADPMSVPQTSGSAKMDLNGDMVTIPLLASPLGSVPMLTDTCVPNDIGIYRWTSPTELGEAEYAVASSSNLPNLQWNSTAPALNPPASSHSESALGEDSKPYSTGRSMSAQNDAMGRLSVPRMPCFKCRTCQSHYLSGSRLSEHLQKFHAPARFACSTCDRGFKREKDLRRHQFIHEPSKRLFACSCTKAYARYDGLLRHFTEMASRQGETCCHKASEPNPT